MPQKILFVEQEDATAAGSVSARQNCNRWQQLMS